MIDVKGLDFTYKGNTNKTIKNMSFSVKKGEIFGFLGPSGAGKSTVQKILIGILKGYRGSVTVLGKDLKDIERSYYESIGVSFELPNLYAKFTALENLNYFRKFYSNETEDPMRLLEMVGLSKDANVRVSNYSKGMKMRLNFCRALINKPQMIFLDEPTSGLDPTNSKMIKDIILKLKGDGKTIFLTTHNMNIADELCDRVAFIVDGEIALIDEPSILKMERTRRIVEVKYMDNDKLMTEEFSLEEIGDNDDFIQILKGKAVQTIHTQEASLEDIFIDTTGRKLI